MNEALLPADTCPSPRLELHEDVKLDIPVHWHGGRTVHVSFLLEGDEIDAMMTVADEAVAPLIRAAYRQDAYRAQVDVWVDSTGLHIIDVCVS